MTTQSYNENMIVLAHNLQSDFNSVDDYENMRIHTVDNLSECVQGSTVEHDEYTLSDDDNDIDILHPKKKSKGNKGKQRNDNDLQNQCSKFMREIVKHKCKAYGKQTMGLCDCMMKLASPELLDIAIDKLFSFCKIDLPGQKLLIKQGVTQSRSYFTPERERSYYTKRKVQGVQYFIFSTKVGDVEENVLLCFSALCAFYGYFHKQMTRIIHDQVTCQIPQHGLIGKVSNHFMNAEVTESLNEFFMS